MWTKNTLAMKLFPLKPQYLPKAFNTFRFSTSSWSTLIGYGKYSWSVPIYSPTAKRRICDRSTSPALHYSAEFFEVCSIICHYLCVGSRYWSIEFRIILVLFREPRYIWWPRKVIWRPASVYKLGPALILVDKEEISYLTYDMFCCRCFCI